MNGKKLTWKKARVLAGYTQASAAEALEDYGFTKGKISFYERNPGKMPISMAIELCKLYGVDIKDIFLSFVSNNSGR
ncbi:helix-turn-helix domain-containing protein [Lactobacillus jensenii]|uniref:helix-turn-helix transcriptional regulator n=1 Tax=Lactobacillus TaxID=1578 RepID=UPI001F341C35|nr:MULTISPECIES: helix-turn-helix transcriptional regulator [Lactobacillus]MCF1851304.1 helix-turn-helix domain-containing protein [Lactobacillus jensenii]MCZ9647618.1 helix-turn-helix domain-containing protein [Lactobacillus mulieris]